MTQRFGRIGGNGPLRGIRVIDCSTTLMGPYATQLMAQLGAEVIKIEQPGGDITRSIGERDGDKLGPIYLNLNRGKSSVVLDLRQSDQYQAFLDYVAQCDVLLHNKPPATARRLRIDYDSLLGVNDRMIYCAVQGFGSNGPYRDLPAYDDIIQAASGMAAVQGGPGGKPEYVRAPIADKVCALFALSSVCAALYARDHGAGGQAIEVPMFECMTSFVLTEAQGDWVFSPPRGEPGYARINSPHRKPFETADGTIAVMPNTDAHWRAFFKVVGAEQMSEDPRYCDIDARTRNIDSLYAFLAQELRSRPTGEWLVALKESGIPVMPVLTVPRLFDNEHLRAAALFETVKHPVAGSLRQARMPVTFSRTACVDVAPAPVLGADSDQDDQSRHDTKEKETP
ncbi:CaiB/BaiF CoA transferase family protein [Mycobacterium sp. MUNTM1]